ncbi:MAG: type II toxin-antitoxin system ParD family antitoxin [Alphaproteobacteria bacterium]|mgnify:FL=1
MATMNVSLPERLKEFVAEKVASGVYANASDYVRELIRRDAEAVERLRAELERGEASGMSEDGVEDVIADLKRRRA